MLATVKGHIGHAFMHILFVHYSVVLLADTSSIGVTCVVLCMTESFLFRVISALWLHARRSPVVHVGRDPRLPVLFFVFLSDPCPAAVLVINGLRPRSPRTRENSFDSFEMARVGTLVDCARTTDHSAIISRA